eukprot:COSAG05_NODE_106_length_18750_cov_677.083105_7_plen_39_part_00
MNFFEAARLEALATTTATTTATSSAKKISAPGTRALII